MVSLVQTYCLLLRKWDVSNARLMTTWPTARVKLAEDSSITREALMAEAFAAYRQIRQSAERRGQLMAALKAVENMTNLAGIKAND